jgi:hypothetical protein
MGLGRSCGSSAASEMALVGFFSQALLFARIAKKEPTIILSD